MIETVGLIQPALQERLVFSNELLDAIGNSSCLQKKAQFQIFWESVQGHAGNLRMLTPLFFEVFHIPTSKALTSCRRRKSLALLLCRPLGKRLLTSKQCLWISIGTVPSSSCILVHCQPYTYTCVMFARPLALHRASCLRLNILTTDPLCLDWSKCAVCPRNSSFLKSRNTWLLVHFRLAHSGKGFPMRKPELTRVSRLYLMAKHLQWRLINQPLSLFPSSPSVWEVASPDKGSVEYWEYMSIWTASSLLIALDALPGAIPDTFVAGCLGGLGPGPRIAGEVAQSRDDRRPCQERLQFLFLLQNT